MEEREGGVAVAIVITGLDRRGEFESAAASRTLLARCDARKHEQRCGYGNNGASVDPGTQAAKPCCGRIRSLPSGSGQKSLGASLCLTGLPSTKLLEQRAFFLRRHRRFAIGLPALIDEPGEHRPHFLDTGGLGYLRIAE